MPTLKPCPFCGSPADPEGWASIDRKGPACTNGECDGAADSEDAWNRRAGLDDAAVERAARAMWKASVPPAQENDFPEHPCIARSLYMKAAFAALTAALNP